MGRRAETHFIFLAAFSLLTALHADAAPILFAETGHYYEAVSFPEDVTQAEIDFALAAWHPHGVAGANGIGWWEARVIATERGGYLATIQSAEENAFVFTLINHPRYWSGGAGPWFGGLQDLDSPNYVEPAGEWVWAKGYVVGEGENRSLFEPMTFTNWYTGEPNNVGGYENVAHFCTPGASLDRSSFWNDRPSNVGTVGFVIEYDSIPEPSTFALLLPVVVATLRRHQ